MSLRTLLVTASMAAMALPGALAQNATTTTTHNFKFQPVGLGSTETMQINVFNSAANSTSGTAASCKGSISFLNSAGTVIGAATSFTVTSGQLFSAKLPFLSSGGSGNRTLIVGEVSYTLTSGTPCALGVTLETYDTSSGATHVEMGGGSFGGGAGQLR